MWQSKWFLDLTAACMFGGLALLVIGNFVAAQSFLRMRLAVEHRSIMQSFLSGLWISRDRAKAIEAQFLARGGSRKVVSVNRIAHRTSLAGVASLLTGLVTMCFMITH
jgi:hypothetical protein